MRPLMPLVFVCSCLAAGCAGGQKMTADRDSATSAKDYAPLATGLSWTYDVAYPGQKGEMTVTIVGEQDGYFVDDREGAFRMTPEGLRDRQRYLIREPLRGGATWKTIVSASAVEHNKIISVGERCESLAGSFPDCLVIESSIRRDKKVTLLARWTWARGIGLVKLETEAEIEGQGRVPQVKQSLVRYATRGAEASKSDTEDAPGTWTR